MKQIQVIIGANYGDEGKGMMTDYFAKKAEENKESCIVVCHNGGSQRGHTVELCDKTRHVFHHFGSGVFAKADTYFADSFLVNPMIYCLEKKELEKKLNIVSSIHCFANPSCCLTLPFDLLINQIAEESRAEKRHGSCGMGIFETILRSKYPLYRMELSNWKELSNQKRKEFLIRVREEYVKERLNEVTNGKLSNAWRERLYSPYLIENFLQDCHEFFLDVTLLESSILYQYDRIIFEGGQGLLLDQSNVEEMPHLTPSNTGLKNPAVFLKDLISLQESVIPEIEVCYVSRTYLTRHGAGNLFGECKREEVYAKEDRTNVTNPYQQSFRYAPLNKEELIKRIQNDFSSEFDSKQNIKLSLAITHWKEKEETHLELEEWNLLKEMIDQMYISDGTTRDTIRIF